MNNSTLGQVKDEITSVPRAEEHDYLSVERSPIQGLGLFTYTHLPAYQIIFTIVGRKVYQPYDVAYAHLNPNWLGTGYEEWLEMDEGDFGIYINHSCSPNLIVNEHLQLITLRSINEGEELLIDYSTTELDPYWSMKCFCGQSCCRKTLLSFQYLPNELQKQYSKFIAPAFFQFAGVTT
jgi:SET domain-containing protein